MSDLFLEEYKASFDKYILGSFGEFETSTSHKLNYIMATIDIKRINDLKTASSVLNFNETKFEELVQRDVDYERVENEIIEKYLKKGDDKFIFFPPLLVSPIVTDSKGKIIDSFTEPKENKDEKEFLITYDENFQVKFPLFTTPPSDYPYVLKTKNYGDISYHNYATKFEFNSNKVDLIVIDGQHRLVSLKSLFDKNPEILENIKIPICLFFAPDAFSTSSISLTKSMRELFITINSTAKQVSGHFITLLNDDSLSSYVIREFADSLKEEGLLHLLEWNERRDRRVSQLNKNYSITTVAILDDALKSYVLKNVLTEKLLKLKEINKNLYEENNCPIETIDFDDENFYITEKVKEQINKYLVKSLKDLILLPNVFKDKVTHLKSAMEDLDIKYRNNKSGARSFKNNVLYEYREYQERIDSHSVKDIQDEFLSFFSDEYRNSFYSKNVFQQGYIKSWVDLFSILSKKDGINLEKYTRTFINAMEKLCFNKEKNIFNHTLEYTQNVIYKNTSIKVNKSTKEQISNLIKSTFLSNIVINELRKESFFDEKLITDFAKNSLNDYFLEFQRNNILEIRKNWRGMFDSEDKIYLKLDSLEKDLDFDNNKELFDKEINLYVDKITKKAKMIFLNILDVTYEDISI